MKEIGCIHNRSKTEVWMCGACGFRHIEDRRLAESALAATRSERDDLALRLDGARVTLDRALHARDEAYALVYGRHPPTLPDRLQTLPAWARSYIADIETNADPAGTVRSVTALRENCAALALVVKELVAERDAARAEVEVLVARLDALHRQEPTRKEGRV